MYALLHTELLFYFISPQQPVLASRDWWPSSAILGYKNAHLPLDLVLLEFYCISFAGRFGLWAQETRLNCYSPSLNQQLQFARIFLPLVSQTGHAHPLGTSGSFPSLPWFTVSQSDGDAVWPQSGTVKLVRNKYWWENMWNCNQSKEQEICSVHRCVCMLMRGHVWTQNQKVGGWHLSCCLMVLSESLSCCVSLHFPITFQ